jgi:PAB1-binding protein PBP1
VAVSHATNGTSSSTNGSSGSSSDPVVKPGSTVILDMEQVVQLHCKACRLDSLAVVGASNKVATSSLSNGDSFTDTEISRVNQTGGIHNGNNNNSGSAHTKELVAVDSIWTSAGDGGSLQPLTPINSRAAKFAGVSVGASMSPQPMHNNNSSSGLSGSIAGWDQFKANEELFNVVSTYDENVYTTRLDASQISAQERYRAEQIAREIENTSTNNIHLAEERGQISSQDYADYDEEDRYSGVLKMNVPLKSSSATGTTTKVPTPKLNYAQAVSKVEIQDNSNAAVPPGFTASTPAVSSTTTDTKMGSKEDKNKAAEVSSVVDVEPITSPSVTVVDETMTSIANEVTENNNQPTEKKSNDTTATVTIPIESEVKTDNIESMDSKPVTTPATALDDTKDQASSATAAAAPPPAAAAPVKSSLNATAKSFALNVNAKSFQPPTSVPTVPLPPPPPPQHPHPHQLPQPHHLHHVQPAQYMYDPTTGLPMMIPQHMMSGGKYSIVTTEFLFWCYLQMLRI